MTKVRVHDEKPWEPTLDTLPVFNPFVSPVEHLGDLKTPVETEEAEVEARPAEALNRAAADALATDEARQTAALAGVKGA